MIGPQEETTGDEEKACECCNYEGAAMMEYTKPRGRGYPEKVRMCDLCATSWAGNDFLYGYESHNASATVCYVGNVLLAVLHKVKA